MKKIVVFGASSSKKSINKELSIYASNQFENAEIIILDLNDFEMPIFSEDKESKYGIPEKANKFYEILKSSNAIIISFVFTGSKKESLPMPKYFGCLNW